MNSAKIMSTHIVT